MLPKYRVDRELTSAELDTQLRQSERIDFEPRYQGCVISMNSTYLESVDKWYDWRGHLSFFTLPMMGIPSAFMSAMACTSIMQMEEWRMSSYDLEILAISASFLSIMLLAFTWLIKRDWFACTHYPIRFNRKKRVVHVFRTDGTVLSAPWDEIHFALGEMYQLGAYEVRGHVLKPDTKMIQDTFALSYIGSLPMPDVKNRPIAVELDVVRLHWEFIRRYMEEGPEAVSHQVQFCLPIDGRRESFRGGMERMFGDITALPLILHVIFWPLCIVVSLHRFIAMRSSKIPIWPEEVEKACEIEPDHPYAIVGNENGIRVAVFPEAAAAAGVRFRPPVNRYTGRK